jgi:hypothetical protein
MSVTIKNPYIVPRRKKPGAKPSGLKFVTRKLSILDPFENGRDLGKVTQTLKSADKVVS